MAKPLGAADPPRYDLDSESYVVNAVTPVRGGPDDNDAQAGHLVAAHGTRENPEVAFTLAAAGRGTGDGHGQAHNTTYVEERTVERTLGREVAAALTASGGHHGHGSPRGDGQDNLVADVTYTDPVSQTLGARDYKGSGNYRDGSIQSCQVVESVVRRLTPLEYERLQGFPDGWTRWTEDGTEVADSHRYKMMGNAVAVPVVEWIARRIAWVDADLREHPERYAYDDEEDA